MAELKNSKANYEVQDLSFQKISDSYILKWNYQKGNGFLIFISSGNKELELGKDVVSELNGCWKELLENQEFHSRNFHVFWIKESIFASQEKRFIIKKSQIEPFLPAKVQVFACEIDEKEEIIYKGKDKENTLYIPLPVRVSIGYKRIWFTRNKRCVFYVRSIKNYKNGMIQYYISGQNQGFPLTSQCLGREMTVILRRNLSLEIAVSEAYEHLYEVEKCDGEKFPFN